MIDKQILDDAWLGIEVNERDLFLPTSVLDPHDNNFHIHLTYLLMQPDFIPFVCKHILGIQLFPFQAMILEEMWKRKFPMLIACRGAGKSFILSVYSILRALLFPGRKIVIVGAAFRQSKVLFEYMETIWGNSPLLRDMFPGQENGPKKDTDRYLLQLGGSKIICLPLGDGQKIRGQRANDIIADEFASIPRDIFETVVAGFGVVKQNTFESVQKAAAKKKAKSLNIHVEDHEEHAVYVKENQIILSGTAYYDFNHFASYWKKWKAIIESKGEQRKIQEIFGGEEAPPNFDWSQYSIIRIPYELIPDGFMDADQVARSKATVHNGIYAMEFGAVFSKDSMGFFKRTLIESCVANESNNLVDHNGEPIVFEASLMGKYGKQYVFGVDPASEVDNFSIVVLEMEKGHRKIVYCWTTTRSEHIEKVKRGFIKEKDFYSYCARKIRDLMRLFPCQHIAMDAQGGGIAVMEALHNTGALKDGEHPIWPIIDPLKPASSDGERGLHILEMCQFVKYDWYSEANHGLRKDFEDKVLLFPRFDTVSLGISAAEDHIKGRTYDTLEDCVMEIEDLKNELATIQMTQTPNGRDRWDTPEVIVAAGKKSKMRKDRYSALLMANMAGRIIDRTPEKADYEFYGGFAFGSNEKVKKNNAEGYYTGPAWFTDNMKDVYDIYD
jgi:hypothetical protein